MRRILKINLISTREAAEIYSYNSDYISSLARTGRIAAKRTGKGWLVDKISLELYLREQKSLRLRG